MSRNSSSIRLLLAGCCVVATCLSVSGMSFAGDKVFTLQPIPPEPAPGATTGKPARDLSGLEPLPMYPPKDFSRPAVPPFRDSGLGDHSHLGAPDDGGIGYKHYDFPSYRYDIWYRPHAFGWGQAERCAPSPFRPRGYGDLFNDPSNCYRMDYNRYQLKESRSDYGPAYYHNQPDGRCADGDWSQYFRPACSPERLQGRSTQVWTLGQNGAHEN